MLTLAECPKQSTSICPSDAQALPQAMHVRTDAQTHNYSPNEQSHAENRAQGGLKEFHLTGEGRWLAGAARSQPDTVNTLAALIASMGPELIPHDHCAFDIRRTRLTHRRKPIPPSTRRLVHIRDNSRCLWCGASENLQLDHIVPWSSGGSDLFDNLRTLCGHCNSSRRNSGYSLDLMCFVIPHGRQCVDCGHDRVYDSSTVEPIFCIRCEHKAIGIPEAPGYTAYFRSDDQLGDQ